MRERAGLIIVVTGFILLVKPNFDIEQMVMSLNYIVANYWPIGLIAIGLLLITPSKKKRKAR